MSISSLLRNYFPVSWRKLKMIQAHQSRWSFSHRQTKKELIVCFDGSCLHGGLVDRLKGIVSTFNLAQKYQWDFYIYFTHPFVLQSYLEANIPHLYTPELTWNPLSTSFIHAIDKPETELLQHLQKKGNRKLFVYCNQDYIKQEANHTEVWKAYFQRLFTPSTYLQTALVKQKPKATELAFHARFTSLLGDFKDITQEVLPLDEQNTLKQKALELIVSILEKEKVQTATVFSDSVSFLEYVSVKDPRIHILAGTPGHTEHSNEESQTLKTFVDFYTLSMFKSIISIKSSKMYSSSFARYASLINKSNYKVENIK